MLPETITSLQNPKIKDAVALQNSSQLRRERGLFVVEGKREIAMCIEGGYSVSVVFFCEEILKREELPALPESVLVKVSPAVYGKIAYREGTEGMVAVFERGVQRTLDDLELGDNPLIAVLESVEKPGNLGAILRTADAAGVDAVIICDPMTDLYNPNLIRASVGGVFAGKVITAYSEETIEWLKLRGIRIFTAQLQDSELYYDADMTKPSAIVLGSESKGLSKIWRDASDRKILIPMLGKLDSLNVSVSMAVLCYEALRQRCGNIGQIERRGG